MATIAARLTSTGTLLVNGAFDEVTQSTISTRANLILASEFDEVFIELARSVYRLNDARAKTKQSINLSLSSELIEEKSYKEFQVQGNKKIL